MHLFLMSLRNFLTSPALTRSGEIQLQDVHTTISMIVVILNRARFAPVSHSTPISAKMSQTHRHLWFYKSHPATER
jgi:hypothetical protein